MIQTEAQWRNTVVDLAELYGWRVYCVENSTREITRRSGARVRVRNVNRGGVGFPDLVLVRGTRLIFAELKRDSQRGHHHPVTDDQQLWIDALTRANGAVFVWRPSDYDEIARTLAPGQ